jgi:hypothetical protein
MKILQRNARYKWSYVCYFAGSSKIAGGTNSVGMDDDNNNKLDLRQRIY